MIETTTAAQAREGTFLVEGAVWLAIEAITTLPGAVLFATPSGMRRYRPAATVFVVAAGPGAADYRLRHALAEARR